MKKIAVYASILGILGVAFGAFGAHGIKGKISDNHYGAYRVGIEYLFFHIAPLFYIATRDFSKSYQLSARCFIMGILFFTGSNLLMTTEAIHHINMHFLWPVTPMGGILMMCGWAILGYTSYKN
jgi:uncharacterized membrane protein YgdD (TMEM256/DUF423 family)